VTPLRIGIVPLTDCAVIAVAREKGFFRRHGIEATLSREASWANVRDKMAAGALDGAQMLAPMCLAARVGADPVAAPLVTALSLGLNGNAIALSNRLWERIVSLVPEAIDRPTLRARALAAVLDEERRAGKAPLRFAVVYPFAAHNYELRYWLAAAGIDPDQDVRLCVVPPPRMVESLERQVIDGFCVGEPWASLAVHQGLGRIAISTYEIWNNSPEKVFAVRREWAAARPEEHRAALRALLEAAAWADDPDNRFELAHLLAGERYVGAPELLLAGSLTGRLPVGSNEPLRVLPDFHVFHRYAASFPWTSHAAWLLVQMLRWGQLAAPIDVLATARDVYLPHLYREAAREVGLEAPAIDVKSEGSHAGPWRLEVPGGAIEMGSDAFIDARRFDPGALVAYLAESEIRDPQLDLDAVARRNP
jgi:ABC-type nitrate/sulfonate/bicarbonate transport system substrate-binding protein